MVNARALASNYVNKSIILTDKSASSSILSELIYSASTVLAFYHDCILRRAAGIPLSFNKVCILVMHSKFTETDCTITNCR